jgi:hypothetical protein
MIDPVDRQLHRHRRLITLTPDPFGRPLPRRLSVSRGVLDWLTARANHPPREASRRSTGQRYRVRDTAHTDRDILTPRSLPSRYRQCQDCLATSCQESRLRSTKHPQHTCSPSPSTERCVSRHLSTFVNHEARAPRRRQPMACSLRPARVAPDVVALGVDGADDRVRLDRSGHRILHAQLELTAK